MTWLRDLAARELLGGIAQVLGGPAPASPPPPPPGDPHDLLTPQERAQLTYMGVDPATAPIGEINRLLKGLGEPPLTGGGEGIDGAAADAAKRVDDALQHNSSALNDADAQLAEAILHATASDEQGKTRLKGLQQSIIDEVAKLGPTLDTAAGQQQLADFLQGKTGDILDVLKTAGLDSTSHGAVLDALAARYQAIGDRQGGSGEHGESGEHDGSGEQAAAGSAPVATSPAVGKPVGVGDQVGAGEPVGVGEPVGAAETLGNDPLLDRLASDPLIAGLGPLGGLPGVMGSMMPPFGMGGGGVPLGMNGGGVPLGMGGGGVPLGDIGSSIGGAIHDAVHASDGPASSATEHLKDPAVAKGDQARGHDTATPASLQDQNDPGTKPPAGPTSPDTSVTLPDGTTMSAPSTAVAKAARAVLGGADIGDAYQQAGIALPAPGTPVGSPVSPSQLVFGDVGQFTDHRVMALGGGKVWVNGQVSALDQLDTGPNFLGWEHPAELSTAASGRR